MAYTPINWQTGDTITADKLNKMDNGWAMESTQLFSETVTTAGQDGLYKRRLSYSQLITADTITVTFDGTEYECPSISEGEYGAPYNDGNPDFSEFPFNLYTASDSRAYLTTQTAGEHTVSVSVPSLQTSADFDKARGYGYVTGSPTELFSETVTTASNPLTGRCSATLAYSDTINADTITVTFDGTEYTCPCIVTSNAYLYGGYSEQGPVFTEYPFTIRSTVDGNTVLTETASTHAISVTASVTSMQTSEDFRKAIGNPSAFEISLGVTTFAEANEAFLSGKRVYVLEATTADAYQYQVIYVDISRHTMSALEANGVNVNLRTFSASSADGVLTD